MMNETVGNCYRLRQPTCAVTQEDGPPQLLTIPGNAILTVVKRFRKNGHNMLTVEWCGSKVSIFEVDLERRGELQIDLAIGKEA